MEASNAIISAGHAEWVVQMQKRGLIKDILIFSKSVILYIASAILTFI